MSIPRCNDSHLKRGYSTAFSQPFSISSTKYKCGSRPYKDMKRLDNSNLWRHNQRDSIAVHRTFSMHDNLCRKLLSSVIRKECLGKLGDKDRLGQKEKNDGWREEREKRIVYAQLFGRVLVTLAAGRNKGRCYFQKANF